MNNNSLTRTFAESMGRSLCFGYSITVTDAFLNLTNYGYYYSLPFSNTVTGSITALSTGDLFKAWHVLIQRAQVAAVESNDDPATYGVIMEMTTLHDGQAEFNLQCVRVAKWENKISEWDVQQRGDLVKFDEGEDRRIIPHETI